MNEHEKKLSKWDILFVVLTASLVLVIPLAAIICYHLQDKETVMDPNEIMNSVVHIKVYQEESTYPGEYYSRGQTWQGSGCFVTPDGVIMTARHVLDESRANIAKIEVTLRDGTVLEAKRWMRADNLDVGFIKVEIKDAPFLVFDDDPQEIGQDVWILGHPLGWDNNWSLTKGIISNLGRDCEGFFGQFLMLQADSASYPGNSGGPMVDEDGEIVGVLVGGIRGTECLSYVSPGDMCKEWMDVFVQWLECVDA